MVKNATYLDLCRETAVQSRRKVNASSDLTPETVPAGRAVRTVLPESRSREAGIQPRLQARPPAEQAARGEPRLLVRSFGHRMGAGVIGPGADGLLRAAMIEALLRCSGSVRVITARSDLERLFRGAFSHSLIRAFGPRLHVEETLEEVIEHLEFEGEFVKTEPHNLSPADSAITAWFATPGPDADVVHQVLQANPTGDLIGLVSGPWPYGPTHLVESEGTAEVPACKVDVSAEQAIASLRAGVSWI